MPHEKPHRRLSLTQPTAIPTRPAREESLPQDALEVERRLRAELTAIQERLDAWEFRLLGLSEAMERVGSVQRLAVTQTFQSANSDDTTVFPRRTAPPHQEDEEAPPSVSPPSPVERERRVRIVTRHRRGREPAQDASSISTAEPASCRQESPERSGDAGRIKAVPTIDPPLDRVRIHVRDTSGWVTPGPDGPGRAYATAG